MYKELQGSFHTNYHQLENHNINIKFDITVQGQLFSTKQLPKFSYLIEKFSNFLSQLQQIYKFQIDESEKSTTIETPRTIKLPHKRKPKHVSSTRKIIITEQNDVNTVVASNPPEEISLLDSSDEDEDEDIQILNIPNSIQSPEEELQGYTMRNRFLDPTPNRNERRTSSFLNTLVFHDQTAEFLPPTIHIHYSSASDSESPNEEEDVDDVDDSE